LKLGYNEEAFLYLVSKEFPNLKTNVIEYFGISERAYYRLIGKKKKSILKPEKLISKIESNWRKEFDDQVKEAILGIKIERKKLFCEKVIDWIRFRDSQIELIKYFKKNWNEKNNIGILKAHNGFGKTLSILGLLLEIFQKNSLKDLKNSSIQVVYFLNTHAQIDNALRVVKQVGLKAIAIKSRGDFCFNDEIEPSSDPFYKMLKCKELRDEDQCEFCNNLTYREEIYNLSSNETLDYCKKKNVCGYYAIKDCLYDSDIIFLCYAQLFNRNIFYSFINSLHKGKETIFIFDESHHLVTFANEIDEKVLSMKNKVVQNPSSDFLKIFARWLRGMEKKFRARIKIEDLDEMEITVDKKRLLKQVEKETGLNKTRIENNLLEFRKIGLNNYGLHNFTNFFYYLIKNSIKEEDGKFYSDYYTSIKLDYNDDIVFRHLYLRFDSILRRIRNKRLMFMSGTLNINQFIQVLKLNEHKLFIKIKKEHEKENKTNVFLMNLLKQRLKDGFYSLEERGILVKEYDYSFPIENRKILVLKDINSNFKQRTKENYKRFGDILFKILKESNYRVAIFFPSYSFMNHVIKNSKLLKDYIRLKKNRVFFEEKKNKAIDNDELIGKYRKSRKGILFGINGGRNSEGLDFKDTQIKIIVIVGLPISFPNSLRNRYMRLYGFANVYFIPAIIKTTQSIGRCIRDEEQKGIIVVLDDRFVNEDKFHDNLPEDLKNLRVVNEYELLKEIKDSKEFLN